MSVVVDDSALERILQRGRARKLLGLPAALSAPMGVAVGKPAPSESDRDSSPRIPPDALVRWGRWSD